MIWNKKILYIIAIFYLLIMMDNVMAKEDSIIKLSGYLTRNLEFYEKHEVVTPTVIIYEDDEIEAGDEAINDIEIPETDEVDFEDIDLAEPIINTQSPIISISQWELNQMYKTTEKKVAYFTFDDGPSPLVTPKILDILKEEEVRGTFFIVGKNAEEYPALIKRIYDEGHMLANHTYTHSYANIYKSSENLIYELNKTEALIQEILGREYSLRLMRFPGGSYGEKSSFKKAVNEEGYIYLDWNSLNGDAEGLEMTEDRLMQRFVTTAGNNMVLVILMHDTDTKKINIELLPKMIKYLRDRGYEFDSLNKVVKGENLANNKTVTY